jgi:hypothetical protein
MTKSDRLLFVAKEILVEALQDGNAEIVSHAFGSNEASIDFFVNGRAYGLGLTLTEFEEPKNEIPPLRAARPRRALGHNGHH